MEIIVVKQGASALTLCGHCGEFCYHKHDTTKITTEMLSDYLTTRGHNDTTVDFIINDIERYLQFQFAE